jgi:hypothetical protein
MLAVLCYDGYISFYRVDFTDPKVNLVRALHKKAHEIPHSPEGSASLKVLSPHNWDVSICYLNRRPREGMAGRGERRLVRQL